MKGCHFGAIYSEKGDAWNSTYPPIISGHIHSRQLLRDNKKIYIPPCKISNSLELEYGDVYYPGSMLQHSFGDTGDNVVSCMDINKR